ncbi:hypothetical protein PK35_04365 [Tamlana nanhaiensis]|uniref:Uncharacterized protein n=1 Tax=Neotamlana nanhaiensis TaxID=1382798 RepID=A0A0D7W4F1_9FLAO|nr:hypothetical protein [Tamlana nanhaiensis]KJD33976.1 hypothetical protein PK35_04365 [Tamlana nanhaiensis]
MKIEDLPFKLGMHFENWEFELEHEDSSETYDMFRYVKGDIKEVLDFEVADIFLYFNLDVLFQVGVYLEKGNLVFKEFQKISNGVFIRGVIEQLSGFIEITYCINGIWREL